MIEEQHYQRQSLQRSENQQKGLLVQNSVFSSRKYPMTIFVPIYPRAHVQQVIGIDYERRTVTARFVLYLTVNVNVSDPKLKDFLKNHLILEFDYNQVIYIPELMKLDNPAYIIEKIVEPQTRQKQDYITYMIKGNIQCFAGFDHMFFPYRQIEVINHLVIRSQTYQNYQIKYNAMLMKKNHQYDQFSPHIIYPQFAGFSIVYQSMNIYTDESKNKMKEKFKPRDDVTSYLLQIVKSKVHQEENKEPTPEENQNLMEILKQVINNIEDRGHERQNHEIPQKHMDELSPFKHLTLKFEMDSLKVAFILENQIPIWTLGVISLYLYTASPDIGNRYGNAILIIVSMIALLTNYRLNHVAHSSITFYEIKIMTVMIVPFLLTISTAIDFYSNQDPDLGSFNKRQSQIQNPFMLVSIIIYIVCFALTGLFFLIMAIKKCFQVSDDKIVRVDKIEQGQCWQNLQDLEWCQPSLRKKITKILSTRNDLIDIKNEKAKEGILKSVTQIYKTMTLNQGTGGLGLKKVESEINSS